MEQPPSRIKRASFRLEAGCQSSVIMNNTARTKLPRQVVWLFAGSSGISYNSHY